MKSSNMARVLLVLAVSLTACAATSAQTNELNVNVRVFPTRTVEERVADDLKEKELRKSAEEKRAAEESARIAETSPGALLSRARTAYVDSDTSFFESVQLQNALRKRDEIDTWQMVMVDGWDKRNIADVIIAIDRPLHLHVYLQNHPSQHRNYSGDRQGHSV